MQTAKDNVAGQLGKDERWEISTPMGETQPVSATQALSELERQVNEGEVDALRPIGTGFDILDSRISGGLKPGELLLLAGAPGCGKTTFAFQAARNIALSGRAAALYVCFEHDETFLASRLISMETVEAGRGPVHFGMTLKQIRSSLMAAADEGRIGFEDAFEKKEGMKTGLRRIESYGHRLFILKGSGANTTMEVLTQLVQDYKQRTGGQVVLFVDYLQKVPLSAPTVSEFERVTRVVVALKDLAMTEDIPVFAIAAADKGGIMAKRMRAYHLWGGSALAYEADIILMLADKYDTVAKLHLEFNLHRAQQFHDWVICTLEKNRAGRDLVDMEFQKMFAYCCFKPEGGLVEEALIDERVYKE